MVVLCVVCPTPLLSKNATPQQTGKFKHWRTFTIGTDTTKSCYIISEPIQTQPSGINRGDTFLSVTHRPSQNIYNEISLRIGYPFSQKGHPFALINKERFSFFTGANVNASKSSQFWAWLENIKKQDDMVNSMKRGNTLIFKGKSSRGTATTDYYSLSGFTAAMKHIDAACPK